MKFKDKHALETLPKTMAALLSKPNELQARLDDPDFYRRDRAGFEKVTSDLGETQRKLAAAEEQWLELEMLREELAGTDGRLLELIGDLVDTGLRAVVVLAG